MSWSQLVPPSSTPRWFSSTHPWVFRPGVVGPGTSARGTNARRVPSLTTDRKQPTMTAPMKPRPIWQAYSDTGALDVECPHCGAERGKWCSREGGRLGRVPCVARAAASGVDRPHDFSEPRHREDA